MQLIRPIRSFRRRFRSRCLIGEKKVQSTYIVSQSDQLKWRLIFSISNTVCWALLPVNVDDKGWGGINGGDVEPPPDNDTDVDDADVDTDADSIADAMDTFLGAMIELGAGACFLSQMISFKLFSSLIFVWISLEMISIHS